VNDSSKFAFLITLWTTVVGGGGFLLGQENIKKAYDPQVLEGNALILMAEQNWDGCVWGTQRLYQAECTHGRCNDVENYYAACREDANSNYKAFAESWRKLLWKRR
jgi:hypothetical protein